MYGIEGTASESSIDGLTTVLQILKRYLAIFWP